MVNKTNVDVIYPELASKQTNNNNNNNKAI